MHTQPSTEHDPLSIRRRSMLRLMGAGMVSAGLMTGLAGLGAGRPAWAANSGPAPLDRPDGAAALARLMAGNLRWAEGRPQARDPIPRRAEQAVAQYPIAAVLSCADSRVAPELAFDQGSGEIFAVRLAGNFANDDGIASLEYAVAVLGVPLLMVLGHSGCGAVSATIDVIRNGTVLPGQLPGLVDAMRPGIEPVVTQSAGTLSPAALLAEATIANVNHTLRDLRGTSPVLSRAIAEGRVATAGAVYDIASGKVTLI